MADDDGCNCMPAKTSYGGGLKLAFSKQQAENKELIDRAIKAKKDGTETIEERETREKKVRKTRAADKLRSPCENLPDPKTLNNWTNDLSKLPQISL